MCIEERHRAPGVGPLSSGQPGFIGLLGSLKPCAVTRGRLGQGSWHFLRA